MAEHYFPETEALQLLAEWERTKDITAIDSLVRLLTPLVAKLVFCRGVSVSMAHEDVQNACLTRLATKLMRGKFDSARGTRLYSWITKITERQIIDCRRKDALYVGRMVPWDDYLSNRLHSNGAEHSHEVICDLRERIMRIGTVLSGREKQAQQWLVLNLLQTDFVYQRWECSDSMSTVFGISPRRSRHIFDLTILSIRHALLGERKPPPVNIYRLCGTRQKALTRYRHRLSAEDFDRLVYLMVGLAPIILESGEYTLFEAIHGAPHKEQRLFPDGESSTIASVPESAPIKFQAGAFSSVRQSRMPALAPSPRTIPSTTSSTLLKVEDHSDFRRNLSDLESRTGRKYSLARALADMVNEGKPQGVVEIEAHSELVSLSDRSLDDGTLLVPLSAFDLRRDLDSGDSSSLIATRVSAQVLPFLRYKSICGRLGATLLTLPAGQMAIPRMTSSAGAAWANETALVASTGPTFDQITLNPSRLTAITRVSRQLLRQASPDVEALVVRDITAAIATELDRVALAGSGIAPQPLGLLSLPVNSAGQYLYSKRAPDMVFGGPVSWANVIAFETAIDSGSQAHNDGTYGWAAAPDVRAKWMEAAKVATYPEFLWSQPDNEIDGRVAGRKAVASSQLPTGKIIFGRWSDLLITSWESVETQINQYTYMNTFEIEIRTTLLCTVSTRYASSFMTSSDSASQ
jgi:HK97 family phage major capsid protein